MLISLGSAIPKPTNSNSPIVTPVRSICIKVPKGEAENVRKKLIERGMLDTAHRIKRSEGHVLIPVTSKDALELGYQQVDEELQEREPKDTDYRQLVKVPEDLRDLLPVSFDVYRGRCYCQAGRGTDAIFQGYRGGHDADFPKAPRDSNG